MASVQLDLNLATVAARICGNESTALDEAAQVILGRAKALASVHVKTGAYLASFGVERVPGESGVTDRVVFNDDPEAAEIEWGHAVETARGPRWVDGQFILTRAARG